MTLQQEIEGLARDLGADFFGVADLVPAREAILRQGEAFLADYPRAIALGIELCHDIVDQLADYRSRAIAVLYQSQAYDVINFRLNVLASRVAGRLQQGGHHVLPIPATSRDNDDEISAIFSHKMAAHLAGLGWIGKSCLLVTPEAGPRVRWVTVLTDAPLEITGAPLDSRCGECRACMESCPVQAITGEPFRIDDPREVRLNALKCQRFFQERGNTEPGPVICGQCLYSCPYGRKRSPVGMAELYASNVIP
ncbi:MAG TPA: 4Fe-4S double cluster binding domain-containing protein [Armatimonadota bacterium]|jgi:epoxyqueuosine reductase QueG